MAWSGQAVAAVAGRRLSEGLGRTFRGTYIVVVPFFLLDQFEAVLGIKLIRLALTKSANSNALLSCVGLREYALKNDGANTLTLVPWVDVQMVNL